MISAEISILIPAYGADAFITSALNGVAGQTFNNWELLVVEDGSQGETEKIVAAFVAQFPRHRVIYEKSPRNMGVSHTRNRLIELAQTNCFAFLDADDVWMPEHLQKGLEKIQDGADFVISGIRIRHLPEETESSFPFPSEDQLKNPVESLLRQNFIQSSSMVMMSRRGWEASGPFDSSLAIGEDVDVWLRCISRFGLVHTGATTCIYTKHAKSAMSDTLKVARDRIAFVRKQRNNFKSERQYYLQLMDAYHNIGRLTLRRTPVSGVSYLVTAVICYLCSVTRR